MNKYEEAANNFLKETKTKMNVEFIGYKKHFHSDKDKRDVYSITFTRENRSFSLDFGQSLKNSGLQVVNKRTNKLGFVVPTEEYNRITKNGTHLKLLKLKINRSKWAPYPLHTCDKIIYPKAPTAYDVLVCLQKYDVGSFDDFCSDFGYNIDSITANKTYKAVCKEFESIQRIWSDDEIEKLQEIS